MRDLYIPSEELFDNGAVDSREYGRFSDRGLSFTGDDGRRIDTPHTEPLPWTNDDEQWNNRYIDERRAYDARVSMWHNRFRDNWPRPRTQRLRVP